MEITDYFNSFGRLLKQRRTLARLTQSDLGFSATTVASWETGKSIPTRDQVLDLIRALYVNDQLANKLLQLAGYKQLDDDDLLHLGNRPVQLQFPEFDDMHDTIPNIPSIDIKRQKSKSLNTTRTTVLISSNEADRSIENLRAQLSDIQASMSAVRTKLDENKNIDSLGNNLGLIAQLEELKERVQRLQATSESITAPVSFPAPEDMKVQLVSASLLERVDEYREEAGSWQSWVGVFLGAFLSLIINIATGGTLTESAWLLLIVYLALTIWTGAIAIHYRKKVNKLREELLSGKTSKSGPA